MRRTADFLAEPLLNNDDLKREINAVSSEYYISIAEGGTRTIWNMIHLLADP
jgi:secreted Zn-dependent insulinase-like peptidase